MKNEKCLQINTTCSNFIYLKLNFSETESTLLVDSGAEVSIFKVNSLKQSCLINSSEKCQKTGINNLSTETIGTASTDISFPNGISLQHKFQLVDQNFPIPTDGILGRDFFTKYHCSINYDTWFLTVITNGETQEIPIEDNLNGDFILPPRCEIYKHVYTEEINDNYVLLSKELKPGVYCANAIVSSQSHVVKLINTNDETIRVDKNFERTYIPLKHYHILSYDKSHVKERNQKLFDELQLKNTPENFKQKLLNLCS